MTMSRQPGWAVAMQDRLLTEIRHATRRIEEFTAMTTQADIDAVTSAIANLKSELDSDDSAIQQEIASLQAANPNLDLSGLQQAVSDLSTSVDNTAALVPAADTPPASS